MNSNRFLRFAIVCAVVLALLLSVAESKGGRGGGGGGGGGRSGSWGRSHAFGSGIYMMPKWHGHNSFNTYADSKSQENSDNGNDNENDNNNNTPNSYAKEPPIFAPLFDLEEMRDNILQLHRANQMVDQLQNGRPQLTEEQLAEQKKSVLQMNAMLNSFLDKGREALRELDAHFQRS